MKRFLVVIAVWGCAPEADDCGRQVRLMRETALARVHGLTADDDVKAQAERAIDVAHCSTDPKAQELARAHANALANRLEGRGNTGDLMALGRNMPGPSGEQIRDRATIGIGAVHAAIERLADDSSEELTAHPQSAFFSSSWLNRPVAAPKTTTSIITFTHARESCVVVVAGADHPNGILRAGVLRGDTSLPLHGDSPVVNWSAQRAPPVTLCTPSEWREHDRVQLKSDATVVVDLELHPSAEDRAAGALRAMWLRDPVDTSSCAQVQTARGRAICALLDR